MSSRKSLLFLDKLLSSFNSFEKSEEIVFPLIIFTGGASESVEPIRFIISSQLLSDLNNKFKSSDVVFLNSFFNGLIFFRDSFRVKSSLGLIFLVATLDTNLSKSLMVERVSINKPLCLSFLIKYSTILCLLKISSLSVDGNANHLFNNLPPIGEIV